jgi:RNase adapter protein RapZ
MTDIQLVLITGMSGSGKSVALAALEDAGYYCVDNLPPELLGPFIELQRTGNSNKVAVAVDVRSATALPGLPQKLDELVASGVRMTSVFLDATNDTLLHRFSETRRGHPLSTASDGKSEHGLMEAIRLERELLSELRERALVIDTSLLRPARLLSQIKELIGHQEHGMTLVFESFAFKRGIPMDADYVFDVRMLPNPHYEPELRSLTGKDAPVAEFLAAQPEVDRMANQIAAFLKAWLPELWKDHRSYVTVAIGCTGGQHRSVYLVEWLTRAFATPWQARSRHREIG